MESNSQHLKRKGVEAFEGSNFSQAIDYFTKALQVDPKDPDILNNRAISYRQIKHYEEALTDATAAVAIAPHEALYHSTRATILTKMRKQLDALQELDYAIKLEPRLEYVLNKVVILKKLNRYQEALDAIENIEQQGMLTPDLAVYKGVILLEVRKFQEAEEIFHGLLNSEQHQLALHYLKVIKNKRN